MGVLRAVILSKDEGWDNQTAVGEVDLSSSYMCTSPSSSQHHCRKCGRALCGHCSDRESTFPPMGFEIPVRMCSDCHQEITTNE